MDYQREADDAVQAILVFVFSRLLTGLLPSILLTTIAMNKVNYVLGAAAHTQGEGRKHSDEQIEKNMRAEMRWMRTPSMKKYILLYILNERRIRFFGFAEPEHRPPSVCLYHCCGCVVFSAVALYTSCTRLHARAHRNNNNNLRRIFSSFSAMF